MSTKVLRWAMRIASVGSVVFLLACSDAFDPWRPSSALAETTIVANPGPFPSPEVAAVAEEKVNWLAPDSPEATACTESFAAKELQDHLRKMTGRPQDFRLAGAESGAGDRLLVGSPASNAAVREQLEKWGIDTKKVSDLGPEGYRIKSVVADGRRATVVAGGGRVGTLYAAYDLLHRLGCRWFAPSDVHEETPHIEGIGDLDVVERPSYVIRGFHAWENRADADFLRWMARNRLNQWCVEQKEHALMHKLGIRMVGGSHTAEALFLNPSAAYPYAHSHFAGIAGKPADPYAVSPECQGDVNKDGKLSYFEAHPEWYAMVDGRRIPGIQGEAGTNYCTSNPDATTEFMTNYVQSLVDGCHRDVDILRFWTLDGGKWCTCAACRALGTPTDRNLLLVYRLDQEIKKARAAGKIKRSIPIRFLVYYDVLTPPTRPLPADFDYETCLGTFFPICRCYTHNFDDPQCPRNANYLKQLYGWAVDPNRHWRGKTVIGEYYNVSGFRSLPICFMHSMAHDIPYYHRYASARQFDYMHVTTAQWGSKTLTNYQMARQLWNVETDCEALWKDYFALRYGPAVDTMRRFYDSLEKMLSGANELKYGLAGRLAHGAKDLFPSAELRYERAAGAKCLGPTFLEIVDHSKTCRQTIDQALVAPLPERIKARIAEDERAFTYGERTIAYYHACVQAFRAGRAGSRDEAKGHFDEARRIAELLRQDTKSVQYCYHDAAVPNALAASYATKALDQLAKLLGPAETASGK